MHKILGMMKVFVRWFFCKAGVRVKFRMEKYTPILGYNDDKEFLDIFNDIKNFTLVGPDRAYALYQIVKKINKSEGDIAEIGVYRGGTAKLFAKVMPNKSIYVFDTFEGMPEVDSKVDWHKQGDFSDTSLTKVKEVLNDFKHIQFVKGIFPDTSDIVKDKKFCFAHVDVDIYKSVKDCCEFFYPRMIPGGIMVFDDYGFPTCPGAKKAVDEFVENTPCVGLYLQTGQYVIFKN